MMLGREMMRLQEVREDGERKFVIIEDMTQPIKLILKP